MAEKRFRSWVGFKGEVETVPTENAVERIRQLESQLADLRSRRDITTLSKEEFEILATETAMSLIKTAQQRESRAMASAERSVADAARIAKEKIDGSEAKAKSILSGAESRGRKYIEAAEVEANELKDEALRKVEALLTQSKREASALSSAAQREAEQIINSASGEVGNFRTWLTSAISESERLYRIQTQSLSAAERAISETRSRLQTAFERLASLQGDIDSNLDDQNRPVKKTFTVSGAEKLTSEAAPIRKVAKKSATGSAKKVTNKPQKKSAKKVTSKKRK
jgi:vacuolar-type H+-ATPase subunit H